MYLFLLMIISVAMASVVALSCSTIDIVGRVQGAQN
jgi:hypothetical protein